MTNKNDILNELYSIDIDKWEVEDEVQMPCPIGSAIKWKHCEGYFYDDNYNKRWCPSPYDFEVEDGEVTEINNSVWIDKK